MRILLNQEVTLGEVENVEVAPTTDGHECMCTEDNGLDFFSCADDFVDLHP